MNFSSLRFLLSGTFACPLLLLLPAAELPADEPGLAELREPFGWRSPQARPPRDKKTGRSKESEQAVERALTWLVEHQRSDGSWSFDHRDGPCRGRCNMHGSLDKSPYAATGMALLALLGAGHTHQQGEHKQAVQAGAAYLVGSIEVRNAKGSLHQPGGTMYGHAIATLAVCEAYGMTHDNDLREPAQRLVNFIVFAQDPVGGGWRYMPRQAGDTSVFGWQLLALKTAHEAYLRVPASTIKKAAHFLDGVQAGGGSTYGYTKPGDGMATTSIGLLSRMLLGAEQDDPALRRGIKKIAAHGPQRDNLYFDFFAAQVLHHAGGKPWEEWNPRLREWLVHAQESEGHAAGSWYVRRSPFAERGGRLYCTCLAALNLEIYYRRPPLYGPKLYEVEFPLE